MVDMDRIVKEMEETGADISDGTTAKTIQYTYLVWKKEILHLSNISLSTGVFPVILKKTKLITALKIVKDPSN